MCLRSHQQQRSYGDSGHVLKVSSDRLEKAMIKPGTPEYKTSGLSTTPGQLLYIYIYILITKYQAISIHNNPFCLHTLVAYIANNMDLDQTALIRVHSVCFHDKISLECI